MTDRSSFRAAQARPDYGMQVEVLISLIYHFLTGSGDSVVDGGVAGACHTIPLSKLVAPTGKVYAFEASPPVAAWLAQYLATIDTAMNIELCPKALGEHAAAVEFIVDRKRPGLSHVRRPGEAKPEATRGDSELVSVPMVSLDDALTKARPISFIKLDLEGMDFAALRGGRNLILRDRPIIAFENARPLDVDEYLRFFDEVEFTIYDMHAVPIGRDYWRTPDISFEAICGPRDAIELRKALVIIHGFWATLGTRRVLDSWRETGEVCLDPFGYVL